MRVLGGDADGIVHAGQGFAPKLFGELGGELFVTVARRGMRGAVRDRRRDYFGRAGYVSGFFFKVWRGRHGTCGRDADFAAGANLPEQFGEGGEVLHAREADNREFGECAPIGAVAHAGERLIDDLRHRQNRVSQPSWRPVCRTWACCAPEVKRKTSGPQPAAATRRSRR